MIRTLVADGNETIRLGLRALFAQQNDQFSVAEAVDKADLFAKIAPDSWELVILEPLLGGDEREDIIRQIRLASPNVHVLVYTELDELKFGVRALRSGAKGYLMKRCAASELLAAALRVGSGRLHISNALAEEVAFNTWEKREEFPHQSLSDRENVVFSMLVCGRTVTKIAETLKLSVKTVSTHKMRAMAKMRCKSLSELVHYAIEHDLKEECETRANSW